MRSAGKQLVGTRVVGPVVEPVGALMVGKVLMVENWVEVAISTVENSLAEKPQAVDC